MESRKCSFGTVVESISRSYFFRICVGVRPTEISQSLEMFFKLHGDKFQGFHLQTTSNPVPCKDQSWYGGMKLFAKYIAYDAFMK